MTAQNLIRWSGPITILAGILYIIGAILHPSGEDLTAILEPFWVPSHQIYWVSLVLLMFGLVGINLRLADRTGWLLKTAFILAFIGTSLTVCIVLLSATVAPIVAEQTPDILEQVLTFPPYLLMVFLLGFGLGYILLGIVIFRGDALPRWSGVLLIFGVILFIVAEMELFDPQSSHFSVTLGDTLFGLGLLWIGFSLWQEKNPFS